MDSAIVSAEPGIVPAAMGAPVLEMRDIAKTFGSIRALTGVSFKAWPGEIHALMGENGAGKSTLMKVLSGVYQADPGGQILIDGKPVVIDGPLDAKAQGIVTIYQELALSPNLTVAENIFLGREPRRGLFVDRAAMTRLATPVLERLGVPFRATTKVSALSIAEQQLVEIARALAANSRILVMDEPTTSLTARETDRLFALIKQLRAEGLAIIYISHRMAEIDELADRVSVIRDGGYVGTLTRAELSPGDIIKMMVGRDLSSFYKKEHKADLKGPVLMSVRDVADGRRVLGCSFDLHAGEVLGIAGLVGAGRTELARLICGIDARKSGTITLEGREVAARNPAEVIAQGIVYLTEDRKALGLYLDMTVRENVNLGVIEEDASRGILLDFAAARRRSAESVNRLGVRCGSDTVNVGSLSGGNQQKVLIARLLETKPRVIVLDEPTRGIDIGAKSEIYRLIDELARAGMGVVVISSEMPEIIGVCDRTLVMRDGLIAGVIESRPGAPITQEAIMALVAGVERAA